MEYRCKRLSKGHYLYRGYNIVCVGYYHPEHRVAWEAHNDNGYGVAHGFSLREVKLWIDELIKDNE